MSTEEIINRCQTIYEDTTFTVAREWKEADPSRKVIGFMPVYIPEEIIHAANMLPMGILGGGDELEVIHGDAFYQSYICRIPRSTIELGLSGRLDFVDGMLFPSICDVIRNLSGMWKLMKPGVYAKYFDVPQNYRDDIGGEYYQEEMQELRKDLEKISGNKITDEAITNSIRIFNEHRQLVRDIYQMRSDKPWNVPSSEVYLLMRAGQILPVEEHIVMLKEYIEESNKVERPKRDNCRIVTTGSFCEQPPLNLIKSIEMSGCYVVDDDYMLVNRWLMEEVETAGDPIKNLADAFLHHSADSSAKYCDKQEDVGQHLLDSVNKNNAEGVIFAAPSFCDPALLERPLLAGRMAKANVPHISFKYAENSGQMQPIREQAGTFADSIKLWG